MLAPLPPLPAAPSLDGKCTFGDVVQTGKNVVITGPSWSAVGEIRKSGLLELHWRTGTMTAVGLYRIDAEELVGVWAWESDAEWVDGDLCSEDLRQETIRRWKE